MVVRLGGNVQLAIKEPGLESVSLFHKYKDTAESLLNTLGKLAPAMATSMLGTGGVSIPTLDLDVKFQASSEVDSLKKIVKTIQDKRFSVPCVSIRWSQYFTIKQASAWLFGQIY